jgi:hypothetical protein
MYLITVPVITDFTQDPMRTAALLHTAVRRLGGDVTVTQDEINEGAVEPDSEAEHGGKAECMTFELSFDDKGVAQAVRLRIVDENTARQIDAEEKTRRAAAQADFERNNATIDA